MSIEAGKEAVESFHGHTFQAGNTYFVDPMHSSRTQHPEDDALMKADLEASQWAVNVQPLSGSPANLAVYM